MYHKDPASPFHFDHVSFLQWFQISITATLPTEREYNVCSVWSKMGTFQMSFWLCKSTATLLQTIYVFTINKTFEMKYCMKFYLKGHQNYSKTNSKVPKKAYFIEYLGKPKIWLLVFLMSFEIKLHAVPHFKGLINGQNISFQQECGSSFTQPKTHLKSTHFTSYKANVAYILFLGLYLKYT